ncbi:MULTISPECIES: DEAD/DEAH box helicase [Mesonia]|uniref:ATP-dependent RNA helicase DbpA n=1 Tax=Mesonia oceanica TaxID=2687242 RepID=A0AC61Y5N4_9FLAO|nr:MULTISPECIES: DEAD/DEAH box helicase [Mesonia]MAN26602.1 DEAD/DEAH box helicase [Mesonia sp.]MAQ40870.1 DEAD/DEAH box helicase [Mesonia sp.]MBJ97791.1 DEAD/DEAH box helicase [Flavobacteriaceae bacterium]VVU99499.1 ATP-dependent RNA helicase DbpA [Mesonia oceanica]|tara:strand:- start:5622 stop:6959 length:1338 start_codon:yes stop_codon:yes gene_type:complete
MSTSFSGLGIQEEIQQALAELKIDQPTLIQQKAISLILQQQKDLVVLAQTGTGKTAAFGLPLLQLVNSKHSHIQAVVLAPTRELGQQILSMIKSFATQLPELKITGVFGGTPVKAQVEDLQQVPHILVATPGRLLDLLERKALSLAQLSYLVLDEADEMLSALKEEVELVFKATPKTRRTLLFTATLPGTIKQLAQNYMGKKVVYVEADMQTSGHQGIQHQYVVVEPIEKLEVLLHFLNTREGERGIIFCKTKAAVNKLSKKLAINKFSSGAIHGSLTQGIRDRIMGQFREGHIQILVATDLAARGIDVKDIAYVVNYHLPDTFDTYVHRSGRTARAGAEGFSLSILQEEEVQELSDFEEALGIQFQSYQKADAQSIEDNNTLLWAKKVFKTKPNREVSEELKTKVKTIFHHLTKEELIEKSLAYYLTQKTSNSAYENSKKDKKQ